jgi:hypothetical protein
MSDTDNGPCPRLLPVAPYIGVLGQHRDFRIERVEAFGLVVVQLVTFAEPVGFAFRFRQGFGLFRRQGLSLAPYFPEVAPGPKNRQDRA